MSYGYFYFIVLITVAFVCWVFNLNDKGED